MSDNWIYIHEENKRTRYVLGEKGTSPLICFGINPSTAVPNDLDRTLNKVKNISKHLKYDGWIMLNLYPLRETKPDKLPKIMKKDIQERNVEEIEKILNEYPNADILCAWGTPIKKRKYLKFCLQDIYNNLTNRELKCIGTTKYGHPRHPLYCKIPNELQTFNIIEYCS